MPTARPLNGADLDGRARRRTQVDGSVYTEKTVLAHVVQAAPVLGGRPFRALKRDEKPLADFQILGELGLGAIASAVHLLIPFFLTAGE